MGWRFRQELQLQSGVPNLFNSLEGWQFMQVFCYNLEGEFHLLWKTSVFALKVVNDIIG